MNIFAVDNSPHESAKSLCDVHVVKMILESAQMLSTAHRVLDGSKEKRLSKTGKRMVTYWVHPIPSMEDTLYKAVHVNHPCTKWVMQSSANYDWLYSHFIELCYEYSYRYNNKTHSTYEKLKEILGIHPTNLPKGSLTPFALAMQHRAWCIVKGNHVQSYRNYYKTKIKDFPMNWKKRNPPEWFYGT